MSKAPVLQREIRKEIFQSHIQKLLIIIGLLFFLLVSIQAPAQSLEKSLHHKLDIELLPTLKMIKGQDVVTFPKETPRKISFILNKNLKVSVIGKDDTLTLVHSARKSENFNEYGLELGPQDNQVTLSYSGVIFNPIINDNSEGLISNEGATLFDSTLWYPSFLNSKKSFEIEIQVPSPWKAISQGQMISLKTEENKSVFHYKEIYPQEEIYLIAGPFTTYESETNSGKKLSVYLREPNTALAQQFLTVLPQYIQHYSELIAPYPYNGFSIVENMWETGFGMPSFTLLGPTVIRLPFIFNSSLPHEVLHNWWGNSVYIDFDKGNWSEGLTTYMADYWQQELNQADTTYRMKSLMNFSDFVTANPKNDFPLNQFKDRHNASSQAVGYSKSMMIFHMLDFQFGKEIFNKAIQDFYNQNIFKKASFDDLKKSFEKVTETNLEGFFKQWLNRKGAPHIELTDTKITKLADGKFQTTYILSQKQKDLYDLSVPVILSLESGVEIRQLAKVNGSIQAFNLISNSRPNKIAIDPEYHVFRHLYIEERPATLSSVFGHPHLHFFYNGNSGETLQFIEAWKKNLEGTSYLHNFDDQFEIPQEGALILVGESPVFAEFMRSQLIDPLAQSKTKNKFQINETTLMIDGQSFELNEVSSVVVARLKEKPEQPVVWVRWSRDNNPEEWAKRLTHYGSSGILIFKGRPAVLQSTWPVTESPLQHKL